MPPTLSREVGTVLATAAAAGEVAVRRAAGSAGARAVAGFVRSDTLAAMFLMAGIALLAGHAIGGRRKRGYPARLARLSNRATRAIR